MSQNISFISSWIKTNSRVLDLGCGDGSLLADLTKQRNISGYGLEIDSGFNQSMYRQRGQCY